jgi:hypothetical protein
MKVLDPSEMVFYLTGPRYAGSTPQLNRKTDRFRGVNFASTGGASGVNFALTPFMTGSSFHYDRQTYYLCRLGRKNGVSS